MRDLDVDAIDRADHELSLDEVNHPVLRHVGARVLLRLLQIPPMGGVRHIDRQQRHAMANGRIGERGDEEIERNPSWMNSASWTSSCRSSGNARLRCRLSCATA